jgi:glycosyltransferase involved in cell wall biosynthesis
VTSAPDISIVIPTYNRASMLRRAIESTLRQDATGLRYEVIVVDNNCSDNTAEVVASLQKSARVPIDYIVERRQGNAYARNTGIERALAPIIAFTDDDSWLEPDFLRRLVAVFEDSHLSFVGGRVLPHWEHDPPPWLSPAHWAPVALLDYGPSPVAITNERPRTLFGSNLAIRRGAFDRVGTFNPDLQRVRGGIGSLEDHDLISRLCVAGEPGLYTPDLVAYTHVPADRLSKRYHRRWHRGHGRFYAILRDPEFERSRTPKILGVPSHLYRQVIVSALKWPLAAVQGKLSDAFEYETKLWFFLGFLGQRAFEGGRKPRQ